MRVGARLRPCGYKLKRPKTDKQQHTQTDRHTHTHTHTHTQGEVKYIEKPLLRDTVTVNGNSYLVLRWVSDNPGAWILHCHIGTCVCVCV